MKLQTQYTRVTLVTTLFILLVAAIGYYFLLRLVFTGELDDSLKVEEVEIYDYINKNNILPAASVVKDQRISFQETSEPVKREFKNIMVFDSALNEKQYGRQLMFPATVNGKYFAVSVIKSIEATRDLLWIILLLTASLVFMLFILLFLANRFLLKKIWKPFTSTLSSIKNFNVSAPSDIHIHPTKIKEFQELNESILQMGKKVTKDYQSLKNFTDHASHEMQTPLAIINSKLDVLIQQPELSEKTMSYIQEIYKSVDKLSRLGNSLLLLARIENNQYTFKQHIKLDEIVLEKKLELEDWINNRGMSLNLQLEPLEVNMNRELAEILVSNLFINAIRHSSVSSTINILATNKELAISNTGHKPLDPSRIFSRFNKSEHSAGSGLGLAIARLICQQCDFELNYYFTNNLHYFRVKC